MRATLIASRFILAGLADGVVCIHAHYQEMLGQSTIAIAMARRSGATASLEDPA